MTTTMTTIQCSKDKALKVPELDVS